MADLRARKSSFVAVLVTGLVYIITGLVGWSYPPDYLAFPKFWSVLFIVAGWTAAMTLVYRRMWLAVASGGLLVGSAIFRSVAIFVELGFSGWLRAFHGGVAPQSSSFSIAGSTWILIAVLLWVGWPQIQATILVGEAGGK